MGPYVEPAECEQDVPPAEGAVEKACDDQVDPAMRRLAPDAPEMNANVHE